MPAAMPHVQTARLRALAVTTAKRSRGAPEVPTIAESGLPGYDLSSWNGILAPAGTPREIITRLRDETVRALQIADVNKRLIAIGADPVGKYTNLYEIDAPENLFDPSLGEDRLPLNAGQEFAGRHFARLLLKAEPQR